MTWTLDTLPESVKNITSHEKYTQEQIEAFLTGANTILSQNGDIAEAIATGISHTTEIMNASQAPKVYYARHMESGLVKAKDRRYKISVDAMKKMMPSFAGKPVFVGHRPGIRVEEIENAADGYVADCFYEPLDAGCWSKIIVTTDKGHDAVKKGWSVSNAFLPTEIAGAGREHDIDYTHEVINARYTHLAIVPDPKYDSAMLLTPEQFKQYQDGKRKELTELQNSKEKPIMKIFRTKKEEVTNASEMLDTDSVELKSGKVMTVAEMVALAEAKEIENEAEQNKADLKKTVTVNGKEITIEELVNQTEATLKADEDQEKADAAQKIIDDKKVADDKAAAKKKAEEITNNSKFKKIVEANQGKKAVVAVSTTSDKQKRGSELYGSASK